jgi:calcineurin-like phosphoesterase family protein
MKSDRLRAIFSRLYGRKNLLVGNHDPDPVLELDWEGIHRGPVHFKDQDTGIKFVGSHWPLREWDGFFRGDLHIHGHVHGNLPNSRRSMDIGVDSVGFTPLTFPDIHARMQQLPELDFTGVETEPFEVKPGW